MNNELLLENVLKDMSKNTNVSKKDILFEKKIYAELDKIILEEIEEIKNIDSKLLENIIPEYNTKQELNDSQIQNILKTKINPILERMDLSNFSGNNPQFVSGLILEVAYTLNLIKNNKINQIKKLVEHTYGFYNKELNQESLSKKENIITTHLNNIFEDWGVDKSEYSKIITEANNYLTEFGIKNLLWNPYEVYIIESILSNNIKSDIIHEQESRFNEHIQSETEKLLNSKISYNANEILRFKNRINAENDPTTKDILKKNLAYHIKDQQEDAKHISIDSTNVWERDAKNQYDQMLRNELSNIEGNISTTPTPEQPQTEKSYLTTQYERAKNYIRPHYERVRDSILNLLRGIKGEPGGENNSAQAIGRTIRDTLYSKKGAIILGASLLGLIAMYIWKKRKGVCYGLTGSRKIVCQKKAIDSVLVSLRSQYKNCPLTSNQEKCEKNVRRLIYDWELRKKEL